MSVSEELLPGSYKGVPFFMSRSQITGGRKDVKQSFVNSNKQTIEDLGLKPRAYTVDAIITADSRGEFYTQLRDRLLAVLEQGGKNVLIHPFYGQIENVVARSFTLIEDMSELGDGKINILFEISDDPGTPVQADNTLSLIESKSGTALTAFNTLVAQEFGVSTISPTNYTSAVTKLDAIFDAFTENITFLSVSATAINEFSNELSNFGKEVTELVKQPQALADSVTSLYNTVNGLYTTVVATFEILRGFFDFGDNDITINETTTGLTERKNNNDVLNAIMQGQALSLAYLNVSQIDFQTVNEVDAAADILEVQYQKVIASSIPEEPKTALTDLRVDVQTFFDQQKLTIQQIITINTPVIPARVLAYQYYGSSELGDNIAELNEDFNVTFLSGKLEIFTE